MAMVDVAVLRKILSAFTNSNQHFAITERSLDLICNRVADRLDAAPDEVERLIRDVRWARDGLIKHATDDGSIITMPKREFELPLIREDDSYGVLDECETYPPLK